MQECPYCGSDLNGAPKRESSRTSAAPGGKTSGNEFVSCPDCGEVIDGFSAH